MAVERRDLLKIAGCAALGAAAGRLPALGERKKPYRGEQWAMVVDLAACRKEEGCRRCIDACHAAHNVPQLDNPRHEVKWIWKEEYKHAFPNQNHDYLHDDLSHEEVLVFCNHCENPPCTTVCPTRATWKREDGVVMMDWHRCIGCRYCMVACPYGSRSFNFVDPRPYLEGQNPEFPTRTKGVVEKCTFCDERLARGLLPACVGEDVCPHGCLVFGDLRDPESPVRKALAGRHAIRRKPMLGTEPAVYYLV